MATSRARITGMLDLTNGRAPSHGPHSMSVEADIAASNPLNDTQTLPGDLPCHDPYAYYKAFLGALNQSGSEENDVPCDRRGNGYCPAHPGAGNTKCNGDQSSATERAPSYNVALRFAGRANLLPLATIIEHGSYSTLQTHGSRRSVNCLYTVVQHDNATSLSLQPCKTSQSIEGNALQKIKEQTHHGNGPDADIVDHATTAAAPPILCTPGSAVAPMTQEGDHRQSSENVLAKETRDVSERKGLKGLFRGVIQHVRHTSRRSESRSSATDPSPFETQWNGAHTPRDSGQRILDGDDDMLRPVQKQDPALFISAHADVLQLSPSEGPESWPKDCKGSLSASDTAGRHFPTIWHIPPNLQDTSAGLAECADLLPSSSYWPAVCDGLASSASTATPDVALDGAPSEPSTLSYGSRDGMLTRYTIDGVPIHRSNAPSLHGYDRTREASFCSAESTSYSGTVLGIDLDLQQDFPPKTRRPPTPVSFGVLTSDETRQDATHDTRTSRSSHSVTSSALPILLPLAAASGIVKPNYATPHISFYSPSGNLIQAEQGSSSRSTSYCEDALISPEQERPTRPAVVPLTTPPASSMPLPAHLKQTQQQHPHHPHHHARHHAHSRIVPQIVATSSIKGCGGVVRADSLTPRSGVRRSSPKTPKGPAPYHLNPFASGISRSRFKGRAPCTVCSKRKVHKSSKILRGNRKGSTIRTTTSNLGPLAGGTLRICFCQPWDGAGDRSTTEACLGDGYHDNASQSHQARGDVQPARVVARRRMDSGVGVDTIGLKVN